jgi:uncharacterized protein (TIGR02246 family)
VIRVLAISAIAATLCCTPLRAPAGEAAQRPAGAADAELRKHLLDIIDRFNRHELRPPESPGFTPDADFVNVQGTWMRGVDEIRRGHKMESATRLKDAKITLVELAIRFIRPDVAVVHQLHVMSGSRRPDGTPLPPHQQISTRVLVKEQGHWTTTAFQNTRVRSK